MYRSYTPGTYKDQGGCGWIQGIRILSLLSFLCIHDTCVNIMTWIACIVLKGRTPPSLPPPLLAPSMSLTKICWFITYYICSVIHGRKLVQWNFTLFVWVIPPVFSNCTSHAANVHTCISSISAAVTEWSETCLCRSETFQNAENKITNDIKNVMA